MHPLRSLSGFSDPALGFVTIVAHEQDGRAVVEGVIELPGLATRTLRLRTDADRLYRYGPGREALLRYVRAALCEDALQDLPLN
ncbi:MAG: hypothetical protein ACK41D_05065 [Rubricoccaceae bacterium]